MKRPLPDSRYPLETYSFSKEKIKPIRLQLLDELKANKNKFSDYFTHQDESRSYEIDLYIDSLEIAKAPDSHDKIMEFCCGLNLPKNYAHVLGEKIKSGSRSLKMGNGTLEMMISVLMNCQQITDIEITLHEAYLDDGSELRASLVEALQETSHLRSLKIDFGGEYDDEAINDVIRALKGHHGLENLEFRLCENPAIPNLPSFSELLRHKDHLSSLSLKYLRGTLEDAREFAQVLAALPALENLNLEGFQGEELQPMSEEWSKPQESGRPARFPKLQSLLLDEDVSFEDRITAKRFISFITNLPSLRYLNVDLTCFGEKSIGKLTSCAEQEKTLVQLGDSFGREQIKHPSFERNRKIQLLMAEMFLREAMDSILQHAVPPAETRNLIIQQALGPRTPSAFDDLRSVGNINRTIRQAFVSSRARWLNYRIRLICGHLRTNPRTDGRWTGRRIETEHHRADLKVLSEFVRSNPGTLHETDRERLLKID